MRATRLMSPRRLVPVLSFALLVPASALAGSADVAARASRSDEALLDKALAYFENGTQDKENTREAAKHFKKAADQFELLRLRGVHNAAFYLQQGNAELLAGRLGHAVLAYHRGLRLAPNNGTLRQHRDYARSRVHYATPVGRPHTSSWPPWLPRPTVPFTAATFVLCFVLMCVCFTRWLMTRESRPFVGAVVFLLVIIAAGGGTWLLAELEAWEESAPLVVVAAADGATLHRGNGPSFPPVAPLPQGLEARLLHQRGDWLQIELSTGEIGWVHRGDVLVDEPVNGTP